jgi:hypothetical protein
MAQGLLDSEELPTPQFIVRLIDSIQELAISKKNTS